MKKLLWACLLVTLLLPMNAWATPTVSWSLAAMLHPNGATTCAPAVPATKTGAIGDELVVFIDLDAQTQTVTAPTSTGVTWSSSHCGNIGGGEQACVFGGQITGTQSAATSYTFTDSTAAHIKQCDMMDVAGTNNVIDTTQTRQGTGNGTTMNVTPTLAQTGEWLGVFQFNYNVTQITSLSFGTGWTGTPTAVNNDFTSGQSAAADYWNVQTNSGAQTDVVNWGTTTYMDYVAIALKPAPAASGQVGFIDD